ncbi:FAD-dependent thymidylate synthase [candidate division KSB1 bacterium]|nr:FAD-dependent thymidylate synthase [candidate division KSB1 bacterium]
MPITKEVDKILGKQFDVLDRGFVVLVDVMGNDDSIVQAARVSYGKGTKSVNADRGLIRYLMRHRHTTPFEMVEFKFHVKLPIFVARQWIRHRTANVNEYSARYSILEDEFYIPEVQALAKQSQSNKQGRESGVPKKEAEKVRSLILENSDKTYELYQYLLNEEEYEKFDSSRSKIARELSRIVIPTNVYTQWYWKIDLHNLFHFLSLRMDDHSQFEIREYANIMAEMVKAAVPFAYEAFEDYRLKAINLTRQEILILKKFLGKIDISDDDIETACDEAELTNKRERGEFKDKIKGLLGRE